jgi:metal-responsive CopG/Arc/MetJ family transcriptional regulator
MARRTKILGFSVPFKLAEEFEELCDQDNRSKSDMFREIFQAYKYHIREKVAQKKPDPLNGDDEQVKNND